MRFRVSVTVALALLVLTMSAWAPACDLFCSFERLGFFGPEVGCEAHSVASSAGNETPAVAAAANMAMNGMAMPADSRPMASAIDSPVAMGLATASCGHEPCVQEAVSVAAKRNVDRSPLVITGVLASPAADFAPGFSQVRAKRSDETPPRLGPFDPLGTTLRI